MKLQLSVLTTMPLRDKCYSSDWIVHSNSGGARFRGVSHILPIVKNSATHIKRINKKFRMKKERSRTKNKTWHTFHSIKKNNNIRTHSHNISIFIYLYIYAYKTPKNRGCRSLLPLVAGAGSEQCFFYYKL